MIRPMASDLIACFRDTLRASGEGELARLTEIAADTSVVYPEGSVSSRLFAMSARELLVTEDSSFSAAASCAGTGRIAVLNFANPHFPGGGVANGAMAQEECLCRSSNLFPCLDRENIQEEFYRYHRENTDYFFSDRLVYTRGVTVFKDDFPLPRRMDRENWFQVDVITCAAPYLAKRRYTNAAVLRNLFEKRIRNILEAAIDNGADILILGAFGCGAFQNPPEQVAEAFRTVLEQDRYRGAFKKIVFAIKSSVTRDPDGVCPNLAAFRRVFGQEAGVPAEDIPLEALRLPGGSCLDTAEKVCAFQKWRRENPWYGKQFSVLGDSISTLEGYLLQGYHAYYKDGICTTSGVEHMEDTWWGKVLEVLGGELLVNNAWSGATVAIHPSQQRDFPSGCSARRTGALHMADVRPDVVMVYMGINDWANGLPLTAEPEEQLRAFTGAYRAMVEGIRGNYPDAEVWCCTLGETYMESKPHFRFPAAYGGIHIRQYNTVIRELAQTFGCRLLDIHSREMPMDTLDGIHPTAAGMDTLAGAVLLSLEDPALSEYMGAAIPLRAEAEETECLQLWLPGEERILRLEGQRHMAGRSTDCDVRLTSPYAARYQATFVREGRNWFLRDNNSVNGTYVNGRRLNAGELVLLKAGDKLSFARKEEAEVL